MDPSHLDVERILRASRIAAPADLAEHEALMRRGCGCYLLSRPC